MAQISFEQALDLTGAPIEAARETDVVDLLEARGRVLAHSVAADRDQPPFARSTRDGYAIRHGQTDRQIIGQLRAGEAWTGDALSPGQAIQIMTGAPIPAGADAVVMVEYITASGGSLQVSREPAVGENIVPQGAEARAGDTLLPAGMRVGPAQIALAATCGKAQLTVYKPPQVAIIATGDELVELDVAPNAQQIRNSNSYAIAALVEAAGGEARRLPVAADTLESLRERILAAWSSDLIVFSGGVSMGEYDLVEGVLADFGAQFHFTGVAMQPGKPVVFGSLPAQAGRPERPFFGLPGNPVSTEVTFHCFVAPFLRALGGATHTSPRWAQATLREAIAAKPAITRVLPALLEQTSVSLVPWQGSGDLAANARANCYVELLPGQSYQAGDIVRILLR